MSEAYPAEYEIEYNERVVIADKRAAVTAALADLLSVQNLTEAHNFVITELSTLGGALA